MMPSTDSVVFDPLVSVIIPAYNAEAFVGQTLQSVLSQTYQNLEVIIVDDGSEDSTCRIVQAIAAEDPRVICLQQTNSGVASARNVGIQTAKGELIAPIDADDIWFPDALEKLVAQFKAQGADLGVVYAWSVDIDEQDRPTGGFHAAMIQGNVYKTLICHNFLGNASSTLIRKSSLDQVGGYDTQLKAQQAQGCEDWDLYLRLAEHYEFRSVPEFLIGYRNLVGSMSGDFSQMARSQQLMLQAVQQAHPEIPGFLYRLSRSSYYLYLAHQSDAGGEAHKTLHWLWQAMKVDPITPVGRLGFYILLIKSLIRVIKHSLVPSKESADETHQGQKFQCDSTLFPNSLNSLYRLPIHRFQIWLKLFVGSALHQFLLKV